MKKIVIILLVQLFCTLAPVFADTFHYYLNGSVDAISESNIKVSGRTFIIEPKVKVTQQFKKNGSFYEERAKLTSIGVGNSVSVRVTGNSVNEIIIERWK